MNLSVEWKLEYPAVWELRKRYSDIAFLSNPTVYWINPNDTLWDIAGHVYGENKYWIILGLANFMADPDLIYPDQTLICPNPEKAIEWYNRILKEFKR